MELKRKLPRHLQLTTLHDTNYTPKTADSSLRPFLALLGLLGHFHLICKPPSDEPSESVSLASFHSRRGELRLLEVRVIPNLRLEEVRVKVDDVRCTEREIDLALHLEERFGETPPVAVVVRHIVRDVLLDFEVPGARDDLAQKSVSLGVHLLVEIEIDDFAAGSEIVEKFLLEFRVLDFVANVLDEVESRPEIQDLLATEGNVLLATPVNASDRDSWCHPQFPEPTSGFRVHLHLRDLRGHWRAKVLGTACGCLSTLDNHKALLFKPRQAQDTLGPANPVSCAL